MPDGPLLIVEDDPDIRDLVSETLADAGYAVELNASKMIKRQAP